MKLNLIEHEGCFEVNMEAETLADAAQIVRFGSGALQKINSLGATAYKDGAVSGHLVIAKSKKWNIGEVHR